MGSTVYLCYVTQYSVLVLLLPLSTLRYFIALTVKIQNVYEKGPSLSVFIELIHYVKMQKKLKKKGFEQEDLRKE